MADPGAAAAGPGPAVAERPARHGRRAGGAAGHAGQGRSALQGRGLERGPLLPGDHAAVPALLAAGGGADRRPRAAGGTEATPRLLCPPAGQRHVAHQLRHHQPGGDAPDHGDPGPEPG